MIILVHGYMCTLPLVLYDNIPQPFVIMLTACLSIQFSVIYGVHLMDEFDTVGR